ncbi:MULTISPECIES: hypothetical protein [unclassified Nocardioides]|uniref:hypothetical protein n=1 Tax=unclassified Nocardioides TaxID=2615069 RepID=UPI0006F299B9|nr:MULTISPECIES: hypothetical protein [unclassified Nocardioides]KRA38345.1 hypothetical protein ASD81_06820 [Nocardioides sp. Root614]KRA92304.1 hypothetical protein ASD84_07085 [Nocardioides sp. Root682]
MRVWGLGVALATAGALSGATLMVGDVHLSVPGVRDAVAVLHTLPGLTAVALAFPLVDRTPDLTLMATVPPWRHFAMRFAAVVALSMPVAACVHAALWSIAGAGAVLGFVGLAAVGCACLGLWYWGPTLLLSFGWIHWPGRDEAALADPIWLVAWLGLLGLCGAGYVAISVRRVQRVVRAAGTSSESRRGADTIRP